MSAPGPGPDTGALYREFFESVPTAQLVTGPDGRIRSANSAAASVLGAEREQLTEHRLSELVAPTSVAAVEAALRAGLAGGRSGPVPIQGRGSHPGAWELWVVRLGSAGSETLGVLLRDLAPPGPVSGGPPANYSLAELLMANRLRELV